MKLSTPRHLRPMSASLAPVVSIVRHAIESRRSGNFLRTSADRLPLMPSDFKRDPAKLAELRAVVEQATDVDEDEDQVEVLQDIRLLLGVIADCQVDILERMLREDGDH